MRRRDGPAKGDDEGEWSERTEDEGVEERTRKGMLKGVKSTDRNKLEDDERKQV